MTFDEKIDKLTERHQALTESLELLTHDIRMLFANTERDSENIRALARIAEIHERRLTGLEEPQ